MDDVENKVRRAANIVLQGLPETWGYNMTPIIEGFRMLPPVAEGYPMPYTTYLLYIVKKYGITAKLLYANALFADVSNFVNSYRSMESAAADITHMDTLNFNAELEAFDDMESAILKPHLGISPLYRYIIAHDVCMEMILKPANAESAILQLRENPFFYFQYPDHINLMPIKWEDL